MLLSSTSSDQEKLRVSVFCVGNSSIPWIASQAPHFETLQRRPAHNPAGKTSSQFVRSFQKIGDKLQASANSTLRPKRAATVISMSGENLSHFPRNRSLTRDCAIPKRSAACACVHPSSLTRTRSRAIKSARSPITAASPGPNPRSVKTLPLDGVTTESGSTGVFFLRMVMLQSVCIVWPPDQCRPLKSSV